MHILLAVIGIFAAAAFWWYRLKYMSEAANEVADAVGRVRGNLRRNTLRRKAAIAPVTAIDHAVTAAATVVMAIAAEDRPVSDVLETRVREQIETVADGEKQLDEAIAYAKWASDQVADVQTVIDRTAASRSRRERATGRNGSCRDAGGGTSSYVPAARGTLAPQARP